MGGVDRRLLTNTVMLYGLTASNYLFGLATIPYLTRVLGAEAYGRVGFATAFSTYVQLVLDFGFLLSATASVSRCEGDRKSISRVFTSVTIAKLGLIVVAGAIVFSIVWIVPMFSADKTFFLLYFLYVAINTLIPDYVYRGMETMSVVTARTVTVKAVFLVLVFLFVKEPTDYRLVPLFYFFGALAAVLWVAGHLKSTLGIWFVKIGPTDVTSVLKDSASFFVSRIASTFYGSLNTMVLGFAYPGSLVLGYFTACNNVVAAGRMMVSPVADSMYPYMLRSHDFALLERVALIGATALTAVCIIGGVFAPYLCEILFGAGYSQAAPLFRVMLPLIPLAMVSYIFGFPALAPIGRADVANGSVVFGAFFHVVLLVVLHALGIFSGVSVCIATVATETVVLAIRAFAYISWKHNLGERQ